jgi:hypothetical protein
MFDTWATFCFAIDDFEIYQTPDMGLGRFPIIYKINQQLVLVISTGDNK